MCFGRAAEVLYLLARAPGTAPPPAPLVGTLVVHLQIGAQIGVSYIGYLAGRAGTTSCCRVAVSSCSGVRYSTSAGATGGDTTCASPHWGTIWRLYIGYLAGRAGTTSC